MKAAKCFFIFILLVSVSCKNDPANNPSEENDIQNSTGIYDIDSSNSRSNGKVLKSEEPFPNQEVADSLPVDNIEKNTRTKTSISMGRYVKIDETISDCSCYCLDISTKATSRLCLQPDKMYINVKFSQTKPDIINVYLVNVAETGPDGKEIPFETFDKNKPIAQITSNGKELDLDWLGFTINGKLALDYAIFGKKTLEGKYKKQ